jgi:hypothetical protein
MLVEDGFVGAALFDELELSAEEIVRLGWYGRFYSRLSPADRLYLETALEVAVSDDAGEHLLAVRPEFKDRIALFLFRTEVYGLCEFVLIPWEGAEVGAAAILAAATELVDGVIAAVGWDPELELRPFADGF